MKLKEKGRNGNTYSAHPSTLGFFLAALVWALPTHAKADGGCDGGFLLGGTAQHAVDPENPANEVIRISTLDPPLFGTVSRALNVKIATLDNQLELKAYFETVPLKTCVGGSPRMQLAIDLNGDGVSDGNAFGYVGSMPFGSGCPSGVWFYTDLTDLVARWDITQLIGPGEIVLPPLQNPFTVPWDLMESLITTQFPFHRVCSGQLTDDTFGIPGMSGIAYYDLISIGNETWNEWEDTAGRGFARCARVDPDDDDDDDDDDRDGDEDDDDREFEENRRNRD